MKLRCITCSGANEHLDVRDLLLSFGGKPFVELGIQVCDAKGGVNTERYFWLYNLYEAIKSSRYLFNVALHLNKDWVERFCEMDFPSELVSFLTLKTGANDYFIKRVQLNFKVGREKSPNVEKLIKAMTYFPNQRFILSYNESNAEIIEQVYKSGVVFDCLFDNSFGEGIVPNKRPTPVFSGVLHGYAGGLSPENVRDELDKLSAILPEDEIIFIDAEGKLKDDNGIFSLSKAQSFFQNASKYLLK